MSDRHRGAFEEILPAEVLLRLRGEGMTRLELAPEFGIHPSPSDTRNHPLTVILRDLVEHALVAVNAVLDSLNRLVLARLGDRVFAVPKDV